MVSWNGMDAFFLLQLTVDTLVVFKPRFLFFYFKKSLLYRWTKPYSSSRPWPGYLRSNDVIFCFEMWQLVTGRIFSANTYPARHGAQSQYGSHTS